MNIMKTRSSNRTKTVDTDKQSAYDQPTSSDPKNRPADLQKKPPKMGDEEISKAVGLYCIGDLPFLLFYNCKDKRWIKQEFSEESKYKGGLKYPSVVCFNHNFSIIVTGGCDNYTGEASESVFKAHVNEADTFTKISSMKNKRYGHCSVVVKNFLYVIGGFDHQDTETTVPSTLVS